MAINWDKKPKFERIKSMPKLKQQIISHLFDFVSTKKADEWWKYTGEFKYNGVEYNLECDCRMDNQVFSYRNMFIEHKQVVIDIDDMVSKGLLN